jgi:hypothetical protein
MDVERLPADRSTSGIRGGAGWPWFWIVRLIEDDKARGA